MCNPSFKDFDGYVGALADLFFFFLLPLNPALGPSHSFTSGSCWDTHRSHSLWRLQKALDSSQLTLKYTLSSVCHWLRCFPESPINTAQSQLLVQLGTKTSSSSSLLWITEPQLIKLLQDVNKMLEIPGRVQLPRNLILTVRQSYAGLCCR